MTKNQSIVMPGFDAACSALSPNSKQLLVGDDKGGIRLVQTDDFSIQRDLTTREACSSIAVWALAFDPTSRVIACGYLEGILELRSL